MDDLEYFRSRQKVHIENRIPFPTCAKCGKVVEGMKVTHRALQNDLVVEVVCHGTKEVTVVGMDLIEDANKLEAGVAFDGSRKIEGIA